MTLARLPWQVHRPAPRADRCTTVGFVAFRPEPRWLAPAMIALGSALTQVVAAPVMTAQGSAPQAATAQPPATGVLRKPLAVDSALLNGREYRADTSPVSAPPKSGSALAAVLADSALRVYELVPEASDNVHAAIDHTVQHMNFIARPIARHRLRKANTVPLSLTVAVRPDTIAVTFDGLNPIITPRDGNAVPWIRGHTGELYDVWMTESGDTLRQVIHSEDGQRENDFVFLDGGDRLELHVVLSTERLPMPLRYMLSFRRPAAAPEQSPAPTSPAVPATGRSSTRPVSVETPRPGYP